MLYLIIVLVAGVAWPCYGMLELGPESKEPLCPSSHLCSGPDKDCSCDATCKVYANCCRDSTHFDEAEQLANLNEFECMSPSTDDGVYMRGKCSEKWDNAEVRERCLKGNALPDPTKFLPFTSTTTAFTYVNYYCAICNGEDPASLLLWHAKVRCFSLAENIYAENYDISFRNGKWGVCKLKECTSSFIPCSTSFIAPGNVTNLTVSCLPVIKTCIDPETENNELLLCQAYGSAPVYVGTKIYRNRHCAACNGYKRYSCHPWSPPYVVGSAFTMILDFTDHSGNEHVGFSGQCGVGGVWDDRSSKCRKVICPNRDDKFVYGECVAGGHTTQGSNTYTTQPTAAPFGNNIVNLMPPITAPTNPVTSAQPASAISGIVENPTDIYLSQTTSHRPTPNTSTAATFSLSPDNESFPLPNTTSSGELDECPKVLLSEGEFIRQANGSVYVPAYGRTYQVWEYEARGGEVLVCWTVKSSHKFSATIGWVSLVGLGLSCFCLLLHLIAFCLVPHLRNLSGRCLASLCLSLLAAYTTLLVNMFSPPRQSGCVVLAAAMYYFLLASFAWMSAIAFDVCYTFYLTRKELRMAGGGGNTRRFVAYSLYGWLLPAILTAVLVTVNQLEPHGVPDNFLPRLGQNWCWFSNRKSLLVFFAVPMGTLTVTNVVFFATTAALIAKMTRGAATPTQAAGGSHHRRQQYRTYLRLLVLMGLTWIIGILAGCLDLEPLWYVYVILNSLQGVFIFLAFTCRTKVLQEVGATSHRMLQRAASRVSGRPLQPHTKGIKDSQTSQSTSFTSTRM